MGIISYVNEEIQVIRERDPAIKSNMEVFLYSSFKAILHYRIAHKLYLKKHYFLARWVSQRAARKTGIEIHPGATIGKGLFIDHGSGVIIGETAELGDNITLYQGVTLGGTGKEQGKRHPTLRDNVMVSAGAKVLGSFTIGENSKIGAGSVVLEEVPPNCTVVGVPGRVVKMNDEKIPRLDMDQVHLPDPISNDIRELQADNIRMHRQIQEMEKCMQCLKENPIPEEKKEEKEMPVLATIQYPKGKDPKHGDNLTKSIAEVLMKELDVKPDQVRVIVREINPKRFSAGGVMGYELEGFEQKED